MLALPTEVGFGNSVWPFTNASGCERFWLSAAVVTPSELPFFATVSSTSATPTPSCPASTDTEIGASVCPLTRMGCSEELSISTAVVAPVELELPEIASVELVEAIIFRPSATKTPLGVSVTAVASADCCVKLSVSVAVAATIFSAPEFWVPISRFIGSIWDILGAHMYSMSGYL